MFAYLTDNRANQLINRDGRSTRLRKLKVTLFIVLALVVSDLSFAGTLPLNTGYDYSNWNTYSYGSNDNYWIRIASYPPVLPNQVGPSWAVSTVGTSWAPPLAGPTGIPSTWINAFGSTNQSPSSSSGPPPFYAIYRKCFCMQPGYSNASIRGSVRSDETIQIWLNSLLYTVLPPSPINLNGPPYQINFTNQTAFRTGRNCLYVLVEDTGVHTGFNLAANLTANNITPIIAQGPNMSFAPCSCGQGIPATLLKKADVEERETIQALTKIAEQRRLRRESPQR